ncbi:Crp/Fnr family transcriptional regulator [Kitasatospora sp. NPDC093558]|uniref:Crp/Fnr family transcriptional regulator n=1 Tax=Kitasatospora sp. NPDC093558 TaxID=3155201 RepID=UPI003433CE49
MGDERWHEMTDGWRPKVLEPGEPLIRQGDRTREVCAVERGVLRIARWEEGFDEPSVIAFRGPGDLIGETPMFVPGMPRTAQVVAHTGAVVLIGQADRLNRFLEKSKGAERLLAEYLFGRNQETLMIQGLGDPEVRLAGLVRPFVRNERLKGGGRAGQVVLRVSRDHLAQGLRLGYRRARPVLDHLSIGRFHSKGLLTIDLARWASCVSRLGA